MLDNKRYTISQVVNGFIVTPDFKEKLDRDDLRVFNQFEDMMSYMKDKFEEDTGKLAVDSFADKITKEDHQRLKTAKENMSWVNDKIWGVGLNRRIYSSLVSAKIYEIKELLAYTDKQLTEIPGIGRKSIKDIRERLETYQYKWIEKNEGGN